MTEEVLHVKVLIIPKMTSAVKYTLAAEVGTIVYDTTLNKLSFNVSSAVGSAAWETITSVAE